MRVRRFLLLILAVLVIAGACRTTRNLHVTEHRDYRIVAYVFGDPGIERIGAYKLTHINYAFGHIQDGRIVLRNPGAVRHLEKLVALKADNPNLKILLSVGGWGADGFSDAALDKDSRRKFAESALAVIDAHDLDGIDLDWEYPGQPGPGIKYREEDRENFTLMLKELRRQLDERSDREGRAGRDRYLLTIASAAGDYFRHTEMDRLHQYLDWVNIMTYDFYGSFSSVTGHHTGLYGRTLRDRNNTESFVRQHLDAGIPPEKLVIGAAFYGRAWRGIKPGGEVIGQPFERYVDEFPYSLLVEKYIDKKGYHRQWDDVAKAPYLWNSDSTTVISYEDPESLREKARYVKSHGLGGIMYWQHAHDMEERLLDVLYENLRGTI